MKTARKKTYLAQSQPDKDKVEAKFLCSLIHLCKDKKIKKANEIIEWCGDCLFLYPIHKVIFKCIRSMIGINDISAISIESYASQHYADEMIIPRKEFLVECCSIEIIDATYLSIETYLDQMRDNYVKNQGLYLSEELKKNLSAPRDDYMRIISGFTSDMELWGTGVLQEDSPAEDLQAFADVLESRMRSGDCEFDDYKTQFTAIKEAGGGWVKGNNIVIQAPTNVGKTTFGLNIGGEQAVEYGKPGYILSFEMTQQEIYSKLIARLTRIDWTRILKGKLNSEELQRVAVVIPRLKNIKIDKNLELSPSQIIQRIKYYKEKMGIEWWMLDYFQNVNYSEAEDRQLPEMERFSRGLKKLSIREELLGIIISQTNDDGKLKNCRSLGHDQDDVLSLAEVKGNPNVIDAKFLKRRGATKLMPFKLNFSGAFSRYEDYTPPPYR